VTIIQEGNWVEFTDSSTGGDTPLNYEWDFGDGSVNSTLINPVHQYTSFGTYTVTLTVTDADGDESIATTTIIVNEDLIPVASFNTNVTIIQVGNWVEFNQPCTSIYLHRNIHRHFDGYRCGW